MKHSDGGPIMHAKPADAAVSNIFDQIRNYFQAIGLDPGSIPAVAAWQNPRPN